MKKVQNPFWAGLRAVSERGSLQVTPPALWNAGGYKRIYLAHIRKTAGTALSTALSSASIENRRQPNTVYREVVGTPGHIVTIEGTVIVGWNRVALSSSLFHIGWSHIPVYRLRVRPDTFLVSVFRDPIKRIVSLFSMYKSWLNSGGVPPDLQREMSSIELQGGVLAFARSLSPEILMNQLYMFSEAGIADDAVHRAEKVHCKLWQERGFASWGPEINKVFPRMHLQNVHGNVGKSRIELGSKERSDLESILEPEYSFLRSIGFASETSG